MVAKQIEVEVGGNSARFVLREDLAPKATHALWESLPIEGPLTHGKLSGEACFLHVHKAPLGELSAQLELAVTSIYRGWMVVHPSPASNRAELLISYGLAEYRCPTGREYVTPIAELDGDGTALFSALQRTLTDGQQMVVIRGVER